jgi:protein-disulfide isomerase
MSKAKRPKSGGKSLVTASKGPSPALIVGIVVVVLFAIAVGFGVYHAQSQQNGGGATPPNATASGVPLGNPDAKAKVDIFIDFQCPVCRAYEAATGATINKLIADGSAQITYHPMAFLDGSSDTRYSSRASAASGCAAADKVFAPFAKLLYDNQPPEGGHGLPDSQLISYGQQAGAGPDFGKCVTDNTYAKWTAGLTDQASQAGVNATPTVRVNGKDVDISSPQALVAAVAAAK